MTVGTLPAWARRLPRANLFFVLLLLATSLPAGAGELPVTEGLLLRLDAAEQAAARQMAGLPPLSNLGPVDRWLNTATGAPNAFQALATARPVFRALAGEAFVRFDGKDDFMAISRPRHSAPAATVFILAAPRSNPGAFSAVFSSAEAGKNDYVSGLNLDFGPAATKELSV
ncbi:MAG TPA: hypothetical protein VGK40_04925, partial [Verrucomicrobiae bacterium]